MSEIKLLRRTELPKYLREKHGITVSYQTLNKYACIGGGPEFRKFGNPALYEPDKADRWVEARMSAPSKGKAA